MGTEYKLNVPGGISSIVNFEDFRNFKSFWKKDEEYGNYFLGNIPNSDWPEIMVWSKEGALGITINGGGGQAWDELEKFVRKLKADFPGLEITDWDSGDDLSENFFES